MYRLTHFIVILALLLLTACGGDEEPTPTPPPPDTPTAAPVPVAQPTDTPVAVVSNNTQPSATATTNVTPIVLPTVNPADVSGKIMIEGSRVLHPLSVAMARRFAQAGFKANIHLEANGTDAGFDDFCKDKTVDLVNASRPAKPLDIEHCQADGRELLEFRIGTGAVVAVVNPANSFIGQNVTMEQLARLFSKDATTWADVDPSWPAEPIIRLSPDDSDGIEDFFIHAVMDPVYGVDGGKSALLEASNLTIVEKGELTLLKEVAQNPNAIGYVEYIDYIESPAEVKLLWLNGVEPSADTFHDHTYLLTQPLFLYTDLHTLQEKPQVAAYVDFFLTDVNKEIMGVGLHAVENEILNTARQQWLDAMQK